MRCSAAQCSAARRRLGGASSFTHTHRTGRKREREPSQTPRSAGRRRTCCRYMDRDGAGSLNRLGPEQSSCGAACSGQPDEHKTEANSGGPIALVAAPRGSCQPQALSRDNLGECWPTARRRAWDSGQELDDAPNEARRAGARSRSRSVMLSREGRVAAGCTMHDAGSDAGSDAGGTGRRTGSRWLLGGGRRAAADKRELRCFARTG